MASCAASSFRGRNPPASLKQRRRPIDHPVRDHQFPGEKSPGLIEARRRRRRRSAADSSFRGRNPPASLKLGPRGQRRLRAVRRGFRGRNPPASLKPRGASGGGGAGSPSFPGEKSPGLIEARRRRHRSARRSASFPGEKSPGLIEAAAAYGRIPGDRRFRGRNPPASLKLGDRAAGAAGAADVSGGEIPRPH